MAALTFLTQAARRRLERSDRGYRFLLNHDYGTTAPRGYPDAPWMNVVPRSALEVSADKVVHWPASS